MYSSQAVIYFKGDLHMEFLPFGESLRNIRKRAGFSQKELAAGICTQAQISRIEKNVEIPSAIILNAISEKLGVDMNYFLEIQEAHRNDFINQVKNDVRSLKRQKNYHELQKLILKVKSNSIFQEGENLKFLNWHEAICMHYVEQKSLEALDLLKNTLLINPFGKKDFYHEIDIEILNSIAILQKELLFVEESENNFKKAIEYLKNIPKLTDDTIQLRSIFGLAQLYTDTNRLDESYQLCQKGIRLCNEYQSLYLLGQFHYQAGENLAKMGERAEAKKAFDKATLIFQLQDNQFYVKLIKENADELLKKD